MSQIAITHDRNTPHLLSQLPSLAQSDKGRKDKDGNGNGCEN